MPLPPLPHRLAAALRRAELARRNRRLERDPGAGDLARGGGAAQPRASRCAPCSTSASAPTPAASARRRSGPGSGATAPRCSPWPWPPASTTPTCGATSPASTASTVESLELHAELNGYPLAARPRPRRRARRLDAPPLPSGRSVAQIPAGADVRGRARETLGTAQADHGLGQLLLADPGAGGRVADPLPRRLGRQPLDQPDDPCRLLEGAGAPQPLGRLLAPRRGRGTAGRRS